MQNTETAAEELTLTTLSLDELDDAELLALARGDHAEAYAALFRRHTYAAHRLARHLGHREEAEDIVAESFAQVLDLVRRGKGPDRAFRAYLFTTIRHEGGRRAKARQRVMPTDDDRHIDSVVPFGGGDLDAFEKSAIRRAYESLPDRWRTVLWHLDVEGRKPQELGPLLDLSPNTVSALVYRARAGLREAYLQQHVNDEGPAIGPVCSSVRAKLSAYVRRTASARERSSIGAHLATCSECDAIHADLREVNREVGTVAGLVATAVSILGPLGAAVAGCWASLTTQAAAIGRAGFAALAPPATVAALTAATVVGMTASDVIDPPRHPMAVQQGMPHANRVRVPSAPIPLTPSPRATPRKVEPRAVGQRPEPALAAGEPDTAGSAQEPSPPPAPNPGSSPEREPAADLDLSLGDAVAVQADDRGISTRIASVTIEIPSRTVASVLSLDTTN